MKVIEHAAICAAVLAASVTACTGVSRDAAHSDPSAAPIATTTSASLCSAVTAQVLKSAALRQFGGPPDEPFTVTKMLCADGWAKVLIDTRPVRNANPPSIVLFHDDEGWRVVQYGSGFNCTDQGVPPSTAVRLEC